MEELKGEKFRVEGVLKTMLRTSKYTATTRKSKHKYWRERESTSADQYEVDVKQLKMPPPVWHLHQVNDNHVERLKKVIQATLCHRHLLTQRLH